MEANKKKEMSMPGLSVFEVPMTPNFIKCWMGKTKVMVSIADFSDEQLRRIGNSFTDELIVEANKKRKLK